MLDQVLAISHNLRQLDSSSQREVSLGVDMWGDGKIQNSFRL